jgi:hypothetical protein
MMPALLRTIFLSVSLIACFPAAVAQDARGRSFTLDVGEHIFLKRERLRIEFVAVPSESRCPADGVCVWAGDAEVLLRVRRVGVAQQAMRLHTNPSFPQVGRYQRYEISLLALFPYPRSDVPIEGRDYQARLLVVER